MPISRICISTRWWLVGQPLGSLGRVVPVPGRLRERAVGVQQERGIVGDAVSPSGVPGPDRSHRLRGDRASGVLLQPFGAKQRRTHGPGPMTAGLLDFRRCGRGSRARLPGPAAAQPHRISVETGFCGPAFQRRGAWEQGTAACARQSWRPRLSRHRQRAGTRPSPVLRCGHGRPRIAQARAWRQAILDFAHTTPCWLTQIRAAPPRQDRTLLMRGRCPTGRIQSRGALAMGRGIDVRLAHSTTMLREDIISRRAARRSLNPPRPAPSARGPVGTASRSCA